VASPFPLPCLVGGVDSVWQCVEGAQDTELSGRQPLNVLFIGA